MFYKRELWASKSAGAKGDVPKICGLMYPLHPCNAFPATARTILYAYFYIETNAQIINDF